MFRRHRVPQESWFVIYKILLTLVVLSPFALGSKASLTPLQVVLVGVLMPIEYLAVDYWRCEPRYRLGIVPTVVFGGTGAIVIVIEIFAHEPPLQGDVRKAAMWIVLAAGPVYLLAHALMRRRINPSDA